MNKNDELYVDVCASNDLVIGGGYIFSHRDNHKKPWRSSDKTNENQIDHIAISRRQDVHKYF